jgi:hypothetical protein
MFEFIGFRRELFGKFAKLFRRDAEERQTELIVLEWRIARKRTKLVARERNANSADHFRTAIALWPKLLQRRLEPVQGLLEHVCRLHCKALLSLYSNANALVCAPVRKELSQSLIRPFE